MKDKDKFFQDLELVLQELISSGNVERNSLGQVRLTEKGNLQVYAFVKMHDIRIISLMVLSVLTAGDKYEEDKNGVSK